MTKRDACAKEVESHIKISKPSEEGTCAILSGAEPRPIASAIRARGETKE